MNQELPGPAIKAEATIVRTVRVPVGALLPLVTTDGKPAQVRIHHVDRGRVILVPHPEGSFVLEPSKETR